MVVYSLLILAQIWPLGPLSGWLLYFFGIAPIIVLALPYSLAPQDVPSSLIIFLFQPWHQLFSQIAPGSLHSKIGTRCIHCYWSVITSRPFQHTELGNRCIHVNTHIWIYYSIYMCIIKNSELTLIPAVPIQYHGVCGCCYALLFFFSSSAISFSSPFTLLGVQTSLEGSNAVSQWPSYMEHSK